MTQQVIGRRVLDRMHCANPQCDHTAHNGPLILSSRCHPRRPLWLAYDNGVLTVTCGVCDAPVAQIAVAGDTLA
jgi:hypothetical protein